MHFTLSEDHPYSPHEIGRHQSWPLTPDTVREGRHRHLRFSSLECWCRDQHLLVIQGADTMRVDMPDDPTVKRHMELLQVRRSGAVPSPELVVFRPGHFNYVFLAQKAELHTLEQRIADKLVKQARRVTRENDRSYEGALLHAPEHFYASFTSAYQVHAGLLKGNELAVGAGTGAEEQSALRITEPHGAEWSACAVPDQDAASGRCCAQFRICPLLHGLRSADTRLVEGERLQCRKGVGDGYSGCALEARCRNAVEKDAALPGIRGRDVDPVITRWHAQRSIRELHLGGKYELAVGQKPAVIE